MKINRHNIEQLVANVNDGLHMKLEEIQFFFKVLEGQNFKDFSKSKRCIGIRMSLYTLTFFSIFLSVLHK